MLHDSCNMIDAFTPVKCVKDHLLKDHFKGQSTDCTNCKLTMHWD